METAENGLLSGRVRLTQPRKGYRAATDPVFLAAAVPARPGEAVLDLGCGAGAALLCLSARVPGLTLAGLELQAEYAALARQNAAQAGVAAEIHHGDAAAPPAALRALVFDHVMLNPPWFAPATGTDAPDPGRATAHREAEGTHAAFLDCALRRLRPGGSVTIIQRAERLADVLSGLTARTGDIAILPLAARSGRPAGRVLVQARKGARGPLTLLPPFVVHAGPDHAADRPDYSPEALAVLADAAPLQLSVYRPGRSQSRR